MSRTMLGSSIAAPLPPVLPLILSVPGEPAFPPPPPESPGPTPVLRSPPGPLASLPAVAEFPAEPPGDPGCPPPGEIEKSPMRFPGGRLSRAAAWEGSTLITTTPLPSPAAGAPLLEAATALPSVEISPTAMISAGRSGEFDCDREESPRFIDDAVLDAASVGAATAAFTPCHCAGRELLALMGTARCG